MSTEKLYWADPLAVTFQASRPRRATFEGKPSLVLERTLFYPEAGGQLADTGTLTVAGKSFPIDDVQIDDDGTIHHLSTALAEPFALPEEAEVLGAIERTRRRDHMAQHTGQHMLSRALADVARAETVSSRLGATTCTVDVDVADLPERALAEAEDLVNAVVTSDVIVRSLFPTPEELAKLPLRRAPKVTTNVRVIEVEGFDLSPCGGTHVTRSGQIGVVRVASVERYKGGTRVTFHAGKRALDDARKKERALGDLARELTCGMLDVGSAVQKLRGELKTRLDALSAARGELVELLAGELLRAHPPRESGTTPIVVLREKDDVGMLRTLAGRLSSRADVVAVCLSGEDGGDSAVVVQRGAGAKFDCGKWLKETAATHGGRGGGRPERAEGRLPRGLDVAALL